jgi:hypothetical protein
MPKFVELWVYLSATPLFGLTATLVVYVLAQAVYTAGQAAWANPVLWSVVGAGQLADLTGVDYPTYFSGAQFIHFLAGPAVVALGWPLWQRRDRAAPALAWAAAGGSGGRCGQRLGLALGWAGLTCRMMWCCRWHPSRSRRRWPWASPTRLAAYRRWRRCLRW